jgi:hypothetical protein
MACRSGCAATPAATPEAPALSSEASPVTQAAPDSPQPAPTSSSADQTQAPPPEAAAVSQPTAHPSSKTNPVSRARANATAHCFTHADASFHSDASAYSGGNTSLHADIYSFAHLGSGSRRRFWSSVWLRSNSDNSRTNNHRYIPYNTAAQNRRWGAIQRQRNRQRRPASLVDAAQVYLDFNPAALQVIAIRDGTTLTEQLQSSFDNSLGQVSYAAGTLGNAAATPFTLATIDFQGIGATGQAGTDIVFAPLVDPRQTKAVDAGVNNTDQLTPITVVVE